MRQATTPALQYRSGIYAFGPEQLAGSGASKTLYEQRLAQAGHGQITSEIVEAPPFYYAEDYHQQYRQEPGWLLRHRRNWGVLPDHLPGEVDPGLLRFRIAVRRCAWCEGSSCRSFCRSLRATEITRHRMLPDARRGLDQPDIVCPGDPSCATTGDGVLKVSVGKRVYTPQNFETYTDENNDRHYQMSEPYTDLNHNGKFDGVWLFGGGRAAMGVTTDVEARAIAFVEGDVTVVIAYIDCIGLLAGDMDLIRNHPMLAGLDIDHIVIGDPTHTLSDTVGLWARRHDHRRDVRPQSVYDNAAAVHVCRHQRAAGAW
jgi:hypothetical protein